MNLKELLNHSARELEKTSDTPFLDAELLLRHVLDKDQAYLHAYPETNISSEQNQIFQALLARREQGEPIAYILEQKEFWSLNLQVNSDVLIPRPETEHLIEWILHHFGAQKNLRIADLGVGSGAIALALAKEKTDWMIDATDISPAALAIAKNNAARLDITNVNFYQGSWCEVLPCDDYAIIVSNPPYLAQSDHHLANLTYEPHHALVSGADGLEAMRIIIKQAKNYLQENGYLVVEHGFEQATQIAAELNLQGYRNIQNHQDLAKLPRFTTATI